LLFDNDAADDGAVGRNGEQERADGWLAHLFNGLEITGLTKPVGGACRDLRAAIFRAADFTGIILWEPGYQTLLEKRRDSRQNLVDDVAGNGLQPSPLAGV
jgi:hypothetical protein